MKQLHFIFFWVMSIGLFAQAPQGSGKRGVG
jgi:hypothetical protein